MARFLQVDQALELAAQMLRADDPGLLHYGLVQTIEQAQIQCNRVTQLLDAPALAAIIAAWTLTHPTERIVGK